MVSVTSNTNAVHLYWCKRSFCALTENNCFVIFGIVRFIGNVYEKEALRNMFGPRQEEVAGG
jgi:hypothetical protein